MAITLKNKDIELQVEKAGEKYRSSRFDWNGFVSSLKFHGVELLGQEKPRFQRNPAIYGRGLQNEFGINKCIGYNDCAVGEWFPKIGTGWLKKDDKPYFFYTQYELEELSFASKVTGDSEAIFACDSGERNGYAYRYTKQITLENSGFSITYSLENKGKKTLDTNEYVHNFLCIGAQRIDCPYSLSFPWKLDPSRFAETNNPDGILLPNGNRIEVTGKTGKQFYLGGLSAGATKKSGLAAEWVLEHTGKKIRLEEKSPFEPEAVHLWGWKSVISPEVFISVRAEPGKTVTWKRVYLVSALA